MFKLLHSKTNQKLYKKHLCNQISYYEKYKWYRAHQLSPSLSTIFNSLHGNMNLEK